ncbi:hypothetical protein [Brumimicrobium mesophilum]|uniref:hypothetical protein n=1 Tax=Brumimicrobium mesophilum TaxID=392717 RepID=UPI000D1406FE|nr:hypothetical protein [Brumimicrobium mesophilum]
MKQNLKERIEKYKSELNNVTENIKNDLIDYFKNFDYECDHKDIEVTSIKSEEDINQIYASPGFYIILADTKFNDNECSFKHKNQTAIYRGHSYSTRKRISSHLANDTYNQNRKSREPNYTVCLKIEDGVNGININDPRYRDWSWTVIVHNMRNSNELIREQAELAFAGAFGKPCK